MTAASIDILFIEKEWLIRRTADAFYKRHLYLCQRYKIEREDLRQIARIAFWEICRRLTDPALLDRYATRKMKFRMFDYLTMQRKYMQRNGNEPTSFDFLVQIGRA